MGRVFGIDLGTTFSLIAYRVDGKPRVIPDRQGGTLVPSVVSFDTEGRVLVGKAAVARRGKDVENTIYSVKRFMGRGLEESRTALKQVPFRVADSSGQVLRFRAGQREVTPPEISAFVLKELKAIAEEHLKEEVRKVVITVPAYFNDSQRQATKDAGKIAGLDVLRIVNEPTAASLAYGLQEKKRGIIAVYDLGGGTFDISILRLQQGLFEVLATCGNTSLGGDDFDHRLAELALSKAKEKGFLSHPSLQQVEWARLEAEKAKRELSENTSAKLKLPIEGTQKIFELGIHRSEFELLIQDLVLSTTTLCEQALKDAKLTKDQIGEVVLVGGSTYIPFVRKTVQEFFGKTPHCELNPEEVVALGAAVQADILAGNIQDMLLLDVTPLSLGIETFGGLMSKLIERNAKIPSSAKEVFTTFVDGQTRVAIRVYQGERELVKDNRSLAEFELQVEPQSAGLPRIEVTFLLDANGILNVSAKDLRTGKAQSIEVRSSYGLTEEEIGRMVEESFEFAESDVRTRLLVDARNEAQIILHAVEKALKKGSPLLSKEERRSIDAALEALQKAKEGDSHLPIVEALDQVEKATERLASLLMDQTVKQLLQNRKMKDVLKEFGAVSETREIGNA